MNLAEKPSQGAGPKPDPMIGELIADRYRVDARLGEGGMGSVYRAEHLHMRKRFAIKVLHSDLCTHQEIVARFEREAMAAANIDHPNVAQAHDFGKLPDGSFYLVLEYVEGTDLRTLLGKGPLSPATAVHITLQMLGALQRAHELGIVHRDLKPENILVFEKDGDTEFVKVLDFGIARVPVSELGSPESRTNDTRPLTQAGTVYGTPEYMAPEQALGAVVDGRADIYAVGVLLFEMLVGKRPYDNKDKVALLGSHVRDPIPSVRERAPKGQWVTHELEQVVTMMLAKDKNERYQTANDAAEALLKLGFDAPVPATRSPSVHAGGAKIIEVPLDTPMVGLERTSDRRIRVHTGERTDQEATTIASKEATVPAPESRRRSTIGPWLFATAALVVAGVLAFSWVKHRGAEGANPVGSVSSSAGAASSSAPAAPVDSKAAALTALGRVASGEIEGGLADLMQLVDKNPKDPALLRALAQGQSKAKRHEDAMKTIRKLLELDATQTKDPLLGPLFEEALAVNPASDEAVAVLVGPMGADGAKFLYDLAWSDRGTNAARLRAMRALRDPKTAKGLPASIHAAVELKTAPWGCKERKALLEKHRAELGAEALPILLEWQKPACGVGKKQDCFPCLKDGNLLPNVIKELEAKSKASPAPSSSKP